MATIDRADVQVARAERSLIRVAMQVWNALETGDDAELTATIEVFTQAAENLAIAHCLRALAERRGAMTPGHGDSRAGLPPGAAVRGPSPRDARCERS